MHLAESVFLSSGTGWVAAPIRLALKIKPTPTRNRTALTNYLHPRMIIVHVDYREPAGCGELSGATILSYWFAKN